MNWRETEKKWNYPLRCVLFERFFSTPPSSINRIAFLIKSFPNTEGANEFASKSNMFSCTNAKHIKGRRSISQREQEGEEGEGGKKEEMNGYTFWATSLIFFKSRSVITGPAISLDNNLTQLATRIVLIGKNRLRG